MFFGTHKTTSITIGLALIFAIGMQRITPAQASTGYLQAGSVYRVTTTGATSDPCGANWANPCNLQYALSIAASGAEIWVASGTYYPDQGAGQTNNDRASTFTLKNGVSIYGGFAGTETLLSQRNVATNVTILSGDIDQVAGNANNSYHVVTGDALSSSAVLDGFTISGGNANAGDNYGGGIYLTSSSPTLRKLTLDTNSGGNGGGLAGFDSNASLTDVTFSNNSVSIHGGGIYLQDGSNMTLLRVTFSTNTSVGYGGGMTVILSSPNLTDVTFDNNKTTGTTNPGGGMYNSDSTPVLNRVTFSNNKAMDAGGGGMYNYASNVQMTNVTFFNNYANRRGGAIANETASPVLNHVTFSGNSSTVQASGGMANFTNSDPVIRNSILWGDTPQEFVNTDTATDNPQIFDSILQGGCPAGGVCTNILTTDPSLASLTNNGGYTQTMAIGENSSALNTGNNSTCATVDQRGFSRSHDSGCDIGAYEAYPLTVTADPQSMIYGGPEPTYTLQYSGFEDGDTSVVVNTSPICSVSGVHSNAGTYPITCSGGSDDKYTFFPYVSGTLTVNKATPTVFVTNSPIIYDGSTHAATVSGSVPGTPGNILTGGSASQSEAGTYAVTANFTPDDTVNYNSLVNASAGNFIINKASPILSTTNSPVTYDGSPQSASVSPSVPGILSNILTGGSASQTNAGTYAVTANFIPTDTANYNSLTSAPAGNFVINKITPTLSVTSLPVTYDGLSHSANVSVSAPGTLSNILTGGAATQSDAGTYAVTADFTPSDTTNYNTLTGASAGNFIINKATPTLSVTNSPLTYDASSHTVTISSSVPGTVSSILVGGSASQTNAGTYAVTANFAPDDSGNYNSLTGASAGNFVIDKATPTLSVTNSPLTYDALFHTATISSSTPGTISNILVDGSASQKNVGTYAVTANFLPADTQNYNSLTAASAGSLVINKATPTLSVTNSPLFYSGSQGGAAVTSSVPGNITNILTGGSATQTNAGTYAVTANFAPTDTVNYNTLTGASAGNFVINKVTPILSVTNSPILYDNLPHEPIIASSIAGTVSNILVGGSASQTSPGTYAVTADFTPTDAVNYNTLVNAPAGNFVISPDITPPGTQIASHPVSPSDWNVSFTFSSEDATATFECQLDGNSFSACISPKSYMDLGGGSHTFTVRAVDTAGNIDPTPASHTWTVTAHQTYYMGSRIVTPASIVPQGGSINGSVSRLWYLEQIGSDSNASAYVNFQSQTGAYSDSHSFYIPNDIQTALISEMLLQINFNGTDISTQIWSWSIYDWTTNLWIKLGDTVGSTTNEWNSLTIPVRNIRRYISSGREIRIQLSSNNASSDLKIDYEALHLTYRAVATPQHVSAPSIPAPRPGIFSLPGQRWVR